jgi:hypothetical protein
MIINYLPDSNDLLLLMKVSSNKNPRLSPEVLLHFSAREGD